jgi:hypothetical protein
MVDFREILHAIEGNLDAIFFFNLVASAIPKLRTFKLLRWVQRNPLINFNRLVDLDEILYEGDDIEDDLESIPLSPVASAISKWWTFKLQRWRNF